MEVRLGALQLKEGQTKLETHSGKQLEIQALTRDGDTVLVEGFTPDMVIVNNDLTSGAPEILREAAQPVIPPVGLGWYQRRKTTHFDTYSELARQFCQPYDIDPWLISTMFHHCGNVNFKEQTGIECVALGVEKVLRQLEQKYAQYGITEKPYVFIKADSGTYGMGIMAVHAAEEVFEMNKKTRKKMQTIKEGTQNTRVIIQEGVPTVDMVEGKVAEPLLYLIAGEVVGCTYRVNEHRDAYGNLNAPGMTFAHACEEDKETGDGAEPNAHCPVLGLIGRLAALAAARECYEPRWDI